MEQRIRLHAVALVRPFAKAVALAGAGGVLASLGWPLTPFGAVALGAGALVAVRAVWRWDQTVLLVTPQTLAVVVERPLLGRVLGYGTIVAGETEIPHVRLPN
jgi:hypothetical protein